METVAGSPTETNGHNARLNLETALKVDSGGIVSLEGMSLNPPDGIDERTAWVELIEGLRNVNELARLARALSV